MKPLPACNQCFNGLAVNCPTGRPKASVCKSCGATFHIECSGKCSLCGSCEFTQKPVGSRVPKRPRRRPKSLKKIRLSKAQEKVQQKTSRPKRQRVRMQLADLTVHLLTFVLFAVLFLGTPLIVDAISGWGGIGQNIFSVIVLPQMIFGMFWIVIRRGSWFRSLIWTLLFGGYFWFCVHQKYLVFDLSAPHFHFLIFTLVFSSLWVMLLRFTGHCLVHFQIDTSLLQPIDKKNSVVRTQSALIFGLMVLTVLVAYQLFKYNVLKWDKVSSNEFTIVNFVSSPFVPGMVGAGILVGVVTAIAFRLLSGQLMKNVVVTLVVVAALYYFRGSLFARVNYFTSGKDIPKGKIVPREEYEHLFGYLSERFGADLGWLERGILQVWSLGQPALILAAVFVSIAIALKAIGYQLRVDSEITRSSNR